ncbi:protein-glutamate methylesterase/protein-glutamine glutaminase [Clostridium cellulovorans]|uniref:Protein-glutamate methylesterase/protein-glutamine glutaminase n=1 Tax=Clostridium cellulovorans (strain ATCC 35296 / DSM 3052 / OCM 3 / 743B) TaxID=573061 RepID=D9SQP9_CLOC7|nr:chemotaxis response regulator protein-glutamate methylesterase [Clostridium cellulovorans]ADL52255.1 response regulator receiver modulated CheB methylesterase [Clostridium cellulovorans 743B]
MVQKLKKKIKVLIVDDSLLFREAISRGIAIDNGIEVIATAKDVYEARDMIIEYLPEVMVLDIEMPKMNGVDFLKRLMPQYPISTIVISSVSERFLEAIEAGAVDYVLKPSVDNIRGFETLINELIKKVKIASTVNVSHWKYKDGDSQKAIMERKYKNQLIAIGASTGGTEAIYSIIKEFPKIMPPIVIVQHMPPVFTKSFAERLNNFCNLEVREAKNGDTLYEGLVLIAPGDTHMVVKKQKEGYYAECYKGEKVSGHCPSVDILFESCAKLSPKNTIGIILTGMGNDGAKGLLAMRKSGAKTIGQDEKTSVVYGMPKVAYNIGAVEKQGSIEDIPKIVNSFLNG